MRLRALKYQSQVSPAPVLKQQLGPFQFFAIAFGSIIGVGWMIVVGDWLRSAGLSYYKASWTIWLNAFSLDRVRLCALTSIQALSKLTPNNRRGGCNTGYMSIAGRP